MAYVRYAISDMLYSLNNSTYSVEILRNDVGQSNNHKFEVGAAGVQLIYESPEDDILVPGIVHSRCEVETIWPTNVADELDDMVEAMVDSQDGVWLMRIERNSVLYWVGPVIIDEVRLEESSAARSCRIVASDGLSLLKTVDYNNNGASYLIDQVLFDDVMTNLQEKWVTYNYLNATQTTERRLAIFDYMYSQDMYNVTTTPSGTTGALTRHMKISPHTFSYTNQEGEVEYLNSYDLLDSICKTMLCRMYYYEAAWYFIPCYYADSARGNLLRWNGQYDTLTTLTDIWAYQIDTSAQQIQKASDWTHTFTPPINEVTITRDTNNGYIVLNDLNLGGGSFVNESGINFTTDDAGYQLYGSVTINREALDPTVGTLNPDRMGRFVLGFQIRFGTSGATYQYYSNDISAQPQGIFNFNFNTDANGNNWAFTPLNVTTPSYSSSSGYFYYYNPDSNNFHYDANFGQGVNLPFSIGIPAVPNDVTAIQVTPQVYCYDRNGEYSQTLQDEIVSQSFQLYFVYSQSNQVITVPNFDVVASSTFGRGSINLGKTYLGQLHQNLGGIMVETSAGVFETTGAWSTQNYDYDTECNDVGVREVLAAHYKSRNVERGNIVMRGTALAPPPFYIFQDADTTAYYAAINYRLVSTPAEIEVTLHKVANEGQALTSTKPKEFGTSPLPDPLPGVGPSSAFGSTFTSNFDFNGDAADAFGQDYSSVFTSAEEIEGYVTYVGPSKGQYFDFNTNTPPTGFDIVRKIYTSDYGLADASSTWHEIHANYRPAKNNTLRQAIKKIDEHTARETNPDRSFIITYQTQGSGLLDEYANAQAAYSLRKISSSYTGNAIKVRNDSGTTLDIGFDSNGDLDTASLQTHIGSGHGTVETWYDQSGNSRNATQIIVGLQPYIALSGTIHEINGKPAIKFASDYLDTAAFAPNPNDAVNQVFVCQFDNVNTRHCVASQWSTSTSTQNWVFQMSEVVVGLRTLWRIDNGNSVAADDTNNGVANYQYLASIESSPSYCRAYYNGSLVNQTSGSIGGGTPNNASRALRIGALSTNGTQLLRGYLQEFVMWSNTSALDIQNISDDVNDYYEVF